MHAENVGGSGVTNCSTNLLYPLETTLTDPIKHFRGTELQIPQVETLSRSKLIALVPAPSIWSLVTSNLASLQFHYSEFL